MSKKLLFNEGGKSEKVPVLNKYTGAESGYPIEITSDLLDEEEKTFIEEIEGNTWQRTSVGKNKCQNDWILTDDGQRMELQSRVYLLENTSYTISDDIGNYHYIVTFYDISDTSITTNYPWTGSTFTTPANTSYCKIKTYQYDVDGNLGTFTNTNIKVQIEEGTIATDYEPYMPIDLSDIRSVGDTVIDDVYEIEIIQATCPYEFGKGGRL